MPLCKDMANMLLKDIVCHPVDKCEALCYRTSYAILMANGLHFATGHIICHSVRNGKHFAKGHHMPSCKEMASILLKDVVCHPVGKWKALC